MSTETSPATDALRRLHALHERLRELQGRLDRGPRISQAHGTNLARVEAQLAEAQAKAKEMRIKTDEKQLSLKTGEANVERRRQQLREAKDNREYQALVEQIHADEMANSVLEDEILECMERLDQVLAKLKQAEGAVAKAREDADKTTRGWEAEAPTIRADFQGLEAELKQVEADLPGDFRDLYRRLVGAKGGDALAEIRGEYCGGCNQHVPVNMINGVMLGKPLCCKSCGRLLYLEHDGAPKKQARVGG